MAWENSLHFATPPRRFPREMTSANWTTAEISYWWRVTTKIWVVLLIGRATREIFLQPIRCTPQTWVVTRHQYGISARVGGVAKCRQFSKATEGITLGSIVADCRFQCFVACYIASCPFMASETSREGQTPPNGELIREMLCIQIQNLTRINVNIKTVSGLHGRIYIPLFVPSSPMIIFIDFIICIATGGDMKDAYVALWDFPRMWFIIS